MRVIAGTLKRRSLKAPSGLAVRPSSDRLRETLFDILGGAVPGGVFVDAFAGSGAVGIEAWSRGFRPVFWIEHAAPALAQLHANLADLGIAPTGVLRRPVLASLTALERHSEVGERGCDVFFLDPPYADAHAVDQVLSALDRRTQLIRPGNRVILECRRGAADPPELQRLHCDRMHRVGDSELRFFCCDAP